jgi:hypothetical protein
MTRVDQLANVMRLAGLGLVLFALDHPLLPVCVGRHRPDEPCDGTRGKHPVPWSWPRDSTLAASLLERVFGIGPRNIGVDCRRSGLLVLDEDRPGDVARAAAEVGAAVPDTFTVSTGKGVHFWFRQPPDLPFGNRVGRFRDYAIDVRGRGGYVVGPGSLHQTGRRYEALDWQCPILPVPGWVADALRWTPPVPVAPATAVRVAPGSARALAGIVRMVLDSAATGRRNEALYWAGRRLFERVRDGHLDDTAADAMLTDAGTTVGLQMTEIRSTVRSARKAVLGG